MNKTTKRPTKGTVRQRLDEAAKDLETCWLTLEAMKHYKADGGAGQRIIDFQPILAGALHKLGLDYRRLAQERKRILQKKSFYNPTWLRRKLRNIGHLQSTLVEAIAIGKSLGDAFAWFFVQDDPTPLFQHFEHAPIFHAPPGIGGLGELTFVQKNPTFNGLFPLYHGLTTFLRIGDITFLDLKTKKVVGTGELKAAEISPGTLRLELVFTSLQSTAASGRREPQASKIPSVMSQRMKEKRKKQVKEMQQLLLRNEAASVSLKTDHNYGPLKDLADLMSAKRQAVVKASEGLLLIAFSSRRSKLSSSIDAADETLPAKLSKAIPDAALTITNPSKDDNALFIGHLHYKEDLSMLSVLPGMPPVFWWPIPTEFVKEVYFRRMHVLTLYNPAFLVQKLRQLGLTVKLDEPTGNYEIHRKTDRHNIAFQGFRYLIGLIQNYMWDESAVVDIIRHIAIDHPAPEQNTQIQLQIIQRYGSPTA